MLAHSAPITTSHCELCPSLEIVVLLVSLLLLLLLLLLVWLLLLLLLLLFVVVGVIVVFNVRMPPMRMWVAPGSAGNVQAVSLLFQQQY
jgi:hypothetical protein